MTNEEENRIAQKFVNDPDWVLVEQKIRDYLEPLKSVMDIDTKKSNDEIATEVRGRQITINQLDRFLKDSRLLGKITNNTPTSFK